MGLMDEIKKDAGDVDMGKVIQWAKDNNKTIDEAKAHFMHKDDE